MAIKQNLVLRVLCPCHHCVSSNLVHRLVFQFFLSANDLGRIKITQLQNSYLCVIVVSSHGVIDPVLYIRDPACAIIAPLSIQYLSSVAQSVAPLSNAICDIISFQRYIDCMNHFLCFAYDRFIDVRDISKTISLEHQGVLVFSF